MYRVNLHPEFELARAARGRRSLVLALAVAMIGIGSLAVASQVVSARILADRVTTMEASLDRRQAGGGPDGAPTADQIATARFLAKMRCNRLNWAPVLAALGEGIGPNLRLSTLTARTATPKTPALLEMTGTFCNGRAALDEVTVFIDVLASDPRVAAMLPVCTLGEVTDGAAAGFSITCRPREGKGSR